MRRDKLVKGLVGAVEGVAVVQIGESRLAGDEGIEPTSSGRRDRRRRELDGGAFERLPYDHGLGDRGERDPGDRGARLRPDIDEPLLGEPDEGFAHRRAADAELRREIPLLQGETRRQAKCHDRLAQRLADRRGRGESAHRRRNLNGRMDLELHGTPSKSGLTD
jgi:hypothetical protein